MGQVSMVGIGSVLSGFVLLTCFTVAQCLVLVSTLFCRPAGRCL